MEKLSKKTEDITGQTINNWYIIGFEEYRLRKNGKRNSYWKCRCKYGHEFIKTYYGINSRGCPKCRGNFPDGRYISGAYYNKILHNAKQTGGNYDRPRDINITIEYLDDLIEKQNFRCALSGIKLEHPVYPRPGKNSKIISQLSENHSKSNASLDRIDGNGGYTMGNVQFVDYKINFLKGIFRDEEVIELSNLITNYQIEKEKQLYLCSTG